MWIIVIIATGGKKSIDLRLGSLQPKVRGKFRKWQMEWLVADIVRFAEEQGICYNAHGRASGSLVIYTSYGRTDAKNRVNISR